MVERFFRDLTQNRLRRGVFHELERLIMAIGDSIDGHNQNPKPFHWTAKANDILEKVTRARVLSIKDDLREALHESILKMTLQYAANCIRRRSCFCSTGNQPHPRSRQRRKMS
jgi:hypothetical protein